MSDEEKFRRIQPAITVRGEVTLRGLPDRVVAELLYGLQQHVAEGVRLDVSPLPNAGSPVAKSASFHHR